MDSPQCTASSTRSSTTDGGQPGGRLAYAGLTGSFGSITLGQIWSAAYNHAGAITDKSQLLRRLRRHLSARQCVVICLFFRRSGFSDGLDLGWRQLDTGKAIDKTEFGVTIGLGEIGRVAIAHTNKRDINTGSFMVDHDDSDETDSVEVMQISVLMSNTAAGVTADLDGDKLTGTGLDKITLEADGTYVIGTGTGALTPDTVSNDCKAAAKTEATTDDCKTVTAYVRTVKTVTPTDGTNSVTVATTETRNFYAEADMGTMPGFKNTHVAVEFSVGGFTPYVGYSKMKKNGATKETKDPHIMALAAVWATPASITWWAARNVKDEDG